MYVLTVSRYCLVISCVGRCQLLLDSQSDADLQYLSFIFKVNTASLKKLKLHIESLHSAKLKEEKASKSKLKGGKGKSVKMDLEKVKLSRISYMSNWTVININHSQTYMLYNFFLFRTFTEAVQGMALTTWMTSCDSEEHVYDLKNESINIA